jgi:hypothetical protein
LREGGHGNRQQQQRAERDGRLELMTKAHWVSSSLQRFEEWLAAQAAAITSSPEGLFGPFNTKQ